MNIAEDASKNLSYAINAIDKNKPNAENAIIALRQIALKGLVEKEEFSQITENYQMNRYEWASIVAFLMDMIKDDDPNKQIEVLRWLAKFDPNPPE